MAIREPSDEVGRGNRNPINNVEIPAAAETFTLVIGDEASSDTTISSINIPIPGNASFRIRFANNSTPLDGDINLNRNGATNAQFADSIGTALAANAGFASAVVTSADIAVVLATPGPVTAPSLAFEPAGYQINDIVPGRDETDVDEVRYRFGGPFTNINPNKDPLQGLARAAVAYTDFFRGIAALSAESGLAQIVSNLQSTLLTSFPADLDGIDRPIAANRKLILRGFKRDANSLVGRGKRDLDYTFTNVTGSRGLRQLILRVFDSFIDLLAVAANTTVVTTLAELQILINARLQEFDVEMGELEFALGRDTRVYDNTIVNDSSDQGLLLYSDQLADVINSISGTINSYTTFAAVLTTAAGIGGTKKLLLKN